MTIMNHSFSQFKATREGRGLISGGGLGLITARDFLLPDSDGIITQGEG